LNFFWPPQSSADTIPELKTSLDAATKKWRSTDSYKYLLGTLTSLNSDTEISRIVAIGLGSLQGFSPFGSQDFIKKLQGWAMTAIFSEFQKFSGTKIRVADQEVRKPI